MRARGERAFEALLSPGAKCARTLRWTWNENGELTGLRYPTGHEIAIDYAGTHQPSTMTAKLGSRTAVLASKITFDGGRLRSFSAGNGMGWSQTRQSDGWADDWRATLPNGTVRRRVTAFHNDPMGNLTQVDEDYKEWSVSYGYNKDLNVLSSVRGPSGSSQYTLAPSGDRSRANADEYCYEEGTHRLASVGAVSYESSPSGAIWKIKSGDGATTLCHDSKEQLVRVVGTGGEVVEQIYNWLHRRVASISPVNGLRSDYRFEGSHLLEERGYASLKAQYPRPTVEYVYLNGLPIAALSSKENADGTQSDAEVTYLFSGERGDVLLEADEQPMVTWWHELEGFGPAKALSRVKAAPVRSYAFGVPGARAIRFHFKDFTATCGAYVATSSVSPSARIGTWGPERSGTSFWTEWLKSGVVGISTSKTGCSGEQPSAEIDEFEVELGSVDARTVNLASAQPYPAVGQQFELDFGAGGYAYFDRDAPAKCDKIEARDSNGATLWQAPSDHPRLWTTKLTGKVKLGIWGQGCNATEKAGGFAVTKVALDSTPPPAVPLVWPGQYQDEGTEMVENWHRHHAPSIGRYLQPEPLLLNPRAAVASPMRGIQTNPYTYAANNPLKYMDPSGLYFVVADSRVQPYLDSLRLGQSAYGQDLYRQLEEAPYPVDIGFGYSSKEYWGQTFGNWVDGQFTGATVGVNYDKIMNSCGKRTVNGNMVHELNHVLQMAQAGNFDAWRRDWVSMSPNAQGVIPGNAIERMANGAVLAYYSQMGWDPTTWLNTLSVGVYPQR